MLNYSKYFFKNVKVLTLYKRYQKLFDCLCPPIGPQIAGPGLVVARYFSLVVPKVGVELPPQGHLKNLMGHEIIRRDGR